MYFSLWFFKYSIDSISHLKKRVDYLVTWWAFSLASSASWAWGIALALLDSFKNCLWENRQTHSLTFVLFILQFLTLLFVWRRSCCSWLSCNLLLSILRFWRWFNVLCFFHFQIFLVRSKFIYLVNLLKLVWLLKIEFSLTLIYWLFFDLFWDSLVFD